jgi:hypothetical protein
LCHWRLFKTKKYKEFKEFEEYKERSQDGRSRARGGAKTRRGFALARPCSMSYRAFKLAAT